MDGTTRGSGQIGVFLLDDHEIVRTGVRDVLEAEPDITVVGEAGTAESALARIPALRPDVAVLDVRLPEIGGGKTYSQLATASLAQPKNTALAGQVQTIFRGETLRGLLLNAYGWWQMGQIMLISAVVAFCAAGLFLILSGLGFWHLRRATLVSEVFPKVATRVEVNAS